MLLVEADALLASLPSRSRSRSICSRRCLLPLAGRFQFFLDGLPAVGVEVGRLDLAFEWRRRRSRRMPCLERLGQPGVDAPGPGCPAPA